MDSIPITLQDIKKLCGESFYKRGRSYYNAGNVVDLIEEAGGDEYTARVVGSDIYKVRLKQKGSQKWHTECSCPAHELYGPCKHVAAVLIALYEQQSDNTKMSNHTNAVQAPVHVPAPGKRREDSTPVDRLLDWAEGQELAFDLSKTSIGSATVSEPGRRLQLQFVFKINHRMHRGQRHSSLTVELRVGLKRLYVVPQIFEFLDAAYHRKSLYFTSHFTFDLTKQEIKEAEAELLYRLYRIKESQELYKSSLTNYYSDYSTGRTLAVDPMMWESILPLLNQVDSVLEMFREPSVPFRMSEEKLPLLFSMNKRPKSHYELQTPALDSLHTLPHYGCVLQNGTIYRTGEKGALLLERLQQLMKQQNAETTLEIPTSRIHRFVQGILPQIEAHIDVQLDENVQKRIMKEKVQAALFIDYESNSLTLRYEFRYAHLRLNPIDQEAKLPAGIILICDSDKEKQWLDQMDRPWLHLQTNSWKTQTEEDLYQTLYQTIASIEQQGDVELYWSEQARNLIRASQTVPFIEARLSSGIDWLEISFEADELENEDKARILQGIVLKKRFVRLRGGAVVSLEERRFDTLKSLLEEVGATQKNIKEATVQLPAIQSLLLPDSNIVKDMKWGASLQQFLERLRHPERNPANLPTSLNVELRDYQITGFRWLKMLSDFGLGGILADDMGLGKTLQSIAYICSELEDSEPLKNNKKPMLIVCPASLCLNWQVEFSRFAPNVRVIVPSGTRSERHKMLSDLSDVDVIVTSYPLLLRDRDVYAQQSFHALILDEAQMIKNAASQTAKAVSGIAAPRRFALTGTPVENAIEDLWSIFNVVFPGLFGNKKAFLALSSKRIAILSAPFILRRLKSEVLNELPDRIDTLQHSELTREQKKLYQSYLSVLHAETLEQLENGGFQHNRIKILAGITRLRQLCCHPGLFIEDYEGGSGKLEQLLEILEECWESGRRVLVFSQFASMLDRIRSELTIRGQEAFYLVGSTPPADRVELCRRFNEGEGDTFLISLKAGGTGLNLTGADTVILYDLWWNPAVEEQAIGRAHRMGQQRVVQVIRLIAQGSIEEKMFELQQHKRELIAEVIDAERDSTSVNRLTEEDIRTLLGL